MIFEINIATSAHIELKDITEEVRNIVRKSKVKEGVCFLFIPHTTAGILINENYDPSVKEDILNCLNKLIPIDGKYLHTEGNAHAHIKSSILGTNKFVYIKNNELVLGTWQGIFFAEFDGPRRRKVLVNVYELK
jgi:secondary thiamine-phosphate synthase enzyme